MADFNQMLSQAGILVADGATGTMLQRAGLPRGVAPERWNLENPQAVRELHRSYIQAGADVILTNTFGGTSFRLEGEGPQGQVREVNRTAAQLAAQVRARTQAIRPRCWVCWSAASTSACARGVTAARA